MSADYLGTLLALSAGVTTTSKVPLSDGTEVEMRFRAAASGGGLYPVDVLVGANNVDGLERRLYQYIPEAHALSRIAGDKALDSALAAFTSPEEQLSIQRSCAVFFLVGQPWRSMRKYGARGLRFVFLEAGGIAAHLNLASGALGCGSVDCASIIDDSFHAAAQLDGVYRALLHTVVVGIPA